MAKEKNYPSDIILYSSPKGNVKIEVFYTGETFWLSQKRMAELFDVDVRTINEHLQNIFATKELQREATIWKIRTVQKCMENSAIRIAAAQESV